MIEGTQRARSVAEAIERLEQSAEGRLVEGRQFGGPMGPARGAGRIAGGLGPSGKLPRGLGCAAPEAFSLRLQPRFEPAAVGQEEAGQQLSGIELDRLFAQPRVGGRFKSYRVAPQSFSVHPYLVVASRDEYVRTQRAAQHVHRLPQRVAGALLVEVRPEHADQRVAPLERPADGQVGEEGDPLRLRDHGQEPVSIGRQELEPSQASKLDHLTTHKARNHSVL